MQQTNNQPEQTRRPALRVALWVGVPLVGVLFLLHTVFAGRTVTYIELNQATGEQRGRTLLYGIPFRTAALKEPAYTVLAETPWPSVLSEVWAPIRIHRHLGRARCALVGGHWGLGATFLRDSERMMLHHGVPEHIRADTIELFIRGIPNGVYPLIYTDKATGHLHADFLVDLSGEHGIEPIRIWPD